MHVFNIHIKLNLKYFTPAHSTKVKVFPIILSRFLNSFVLRELLVRVPRKAFPILGPGHHLLIFVFTSLM